MNAVPRSLLRYLPLFTEDGATRGQGECLFSYAAFSAEGSEGMEKIRGLSGAISRSEGSRPSRGTRG